MTTAKHRITIITTRHIDIAAPVAEHPPEHLDPDISEALEQGRIAHRRAKATQAARDARKDS